MDTPAKQQIAERVKQANNILVTVSNNPSVDQLAAAIGLTLLLNRMEKHTTAVFSGNVPSTLEFLQPEKTIEHNTDSLRDFIISLDKSKADKLRYKVEDQVVRIFITPYRTSLSEKDLVFSQGDFNVELIVALGVRDRSQLDKAIVAHGRILHDATIVSLEAGPGNPPSLGQINWQDPAASSLCEMLVSISEAFGPGLIDNQMATAFLTGIVAQTERFSNSKTSPKIMTMSAQLMAAGANQQLIVSKLEPPPPPPLPPPQKPPEPPKKKPIKKALPPKPQVTPRNEGGTLDVSGQPPGTNSDEISIDPNEILIDEQGNLKTAEEIKAEVNRRKAMPGQKPEEKKDDRDKEEIKDTESGENIPVHSPPPSADDLISSLPPVDLGNAPPVMPPMPTPPPPINMEPPVPPPPPPPPPPVSTVPPAQQPLSAPVVHPTPPEADQNKHAFLNAATPPAGAGAPFTSNTTDGSKSVWSMDSNSTPIDPLSVAAPPGSAAGKSDAGIGHSKVIQPPAPHNTPLDVLLNREADIYTPQPQAPLGPQPAIPGPISADNARMAVEQAMANQAFNQPYLPPVQALGAQPLGPELHTPPPGAAGPSLNLPNADGLPPVNPGPPPPTPPPLPQNPFPFIPPPQNPS